jgi:TonB family protein
LDIKRELMKLILFVSLLISALSLNAQTDTMQISKVDSGIYHNPEIQAMYPGGQNAWMRYLEQNLRYPEEAQPKKIQGTVVVQFWVDSKGLSHDVTAISGPEELREESVRVIKNVKMWMPAVYNGKRANAWKTQPISYRLESQ